MCTRITYIIICLIKRVSTLVVCGIIIYVYIIYSLKPCNGYICGAFFINTFIHTQLFVKNRYVKNLNYIYTFIHYIN